MRTVTCPDLQLLEEVADLIILISEPLNLSLSHIKTFDDRQGYCQPAIVDAIAHQIHVSLICPAEDTSHESNPTTPG
jgi:hypothetical protein